MCTATASQKADSIMQSERNYDVIVAGGGPSGFIAAIAAARLGAKTLLIERYGFLGGMPTAACIGPISPFHFQDEQVIAGIPQQFIDRMVELGGSTGHAKATDPKGHGSYVCFYDRQIYKWAALQMVREAGVELLLHSFISGVRVEEGKLRAVNAVSKSGVGSYGAHVVIDATGDGDIAALAGAQHTIGRSDGTLQPATLMFEMAQVDTDAVKAYMDANPDDFWRRSEIVTMRPFAANLEKRYFCGQGFVKAVKEATAAEELQLGRDSVLFWTTVRPGVLHFNSTRVARVDALSAEDLTRAEIEGREQVMSLASFLRKRVPGFASAYVSDTGIQIGIRESRHILGDHVLTQEDICRGTKYADVIARGYFPIDIHNPNGREGAVNDGGVWQDIHDSYDIPFRCLVPRGVEGLIVAGRAISATHEAHASFRTQGGVMAIGHAAGAAAALAARDCIEPRRININTLQRALEAEGALLRHDPVQAEKQRRKADEAVQDALARGLITTAYVRTVQRKLKAPVRAVG
jgi:hypothetical protein